jgi:hypothetical protein
MTTQQNIDGRYILQGDGCAWVYARIRGGKMVSMVEEAEVSTHVASSDSYAWLGDLDTNDLADADDLTEEEHAAIVREVLGEFANPEAVAISRIER